MKRNYYYMLWLSVINVVFITYYNTTYADYQYSAAQQSTSQGKYIVKLKDNPESDNQFRQSLTYLNKTNGQESFKLLKIAKNTYSLTLQDNKSMQRLHFKSLMTNDNVDYIKQDRVGFFKPLPNPIPVKKLQDELLKKKINSLESTYINSNNNLSHSLQWDEFNGPEGVFLESKPDLLDGAWRYSLGQASNSQYNDIVVAVLDTGIEYNDNLYNNVLLNPIEGKVFGWNFSANNDDLSDETGGYHGTHVAGTIAAHGDTVKGMGTELKILPVKIPDETGMFYESNVLKAIYWAIGEDVEGVERNIYPAKVINMSFGIDEYIGKEADECSPAVQEAIDYAREKGVIIVVAAGNSNMEHDLGSPAGCKGALRIASTGPTGLRSYFSNFGEGVNFAAPGGDKKYGQFGGILSTVKHDQGLDNSGFDFYQGTSMASPHVAGLAGLIYSLNDTIRNYQTKDVERIMHATTHDFAQGFDDNNSCIGAKSCGHGIIDANNALEAALANYDAIYTSPSSEFLELIEDENCRSGLLKPKNSEIIRAEGTWVLDESSNICQYKNQFSHPKITMDYDNNVITATYGHVIYKLNYFNRYSICNQIGYDGVGCYI